MMSIIAFFLIIFIYQAKGTEDQCHLDCSSSDRPVGPTRPWHEQDPLRNPLRLTRPHPFHNGYNDEHRYEFPEFCKLGRFVCCYSLLHIPSLIYLKILSVCHVFIFQGAHTFSSNQNQQSPGKVR